jgi:hypothetical protein
VFERYIEARRVIFFGRMEAGRVGSDSVEAKHILLGLLKDNVPLISRLLPLETISVLRESVPRTIVNRESIPRYGGLAVN